MQLVELKKAWPHCSRPERVVWAVAEHNGRRSICPLGWKMKTSIKPPMMAVSIAPARFTHELVADSGEFVLAWPGEELAEATMLCGTRSGRDHDKFAETGLTALPARHVRAPIIKECNVNFECRVAGQLKSGDHTIFTGEILAAWVNDAPSRALCSVDESAGYEFLLERNGYRFGVVKT
ncbi:MAG: flavin reductase family protein [Lentisphaerae bacterium]|nr:flavin reductase family protein [Lentisphaerota bacterium]